MTQFLAELITVINPGLKVAVKHGMCLESDWPYPSRYDPTMPKADLEKFEMRASTEISMLKNESHKCQEDRFKLAIRVAELEAKSA